MISRHHHDCYRFEMVLEGELIVEGAVLRRGDIHTSEPNQAYGHHQAGPDGCLTLEIFSRQGGMLPEDQPVRYASGGALTALVQSLRQGVVSAESAAASPVVKEWAKEAISQQTTLRAEVAAREGRTTR